MTKNTKVVLIVIAACIVVGTFFLLILASLTIPAMQTVIRHGNETSAINTLKLLNTEEQTYTFTYPQRGFACSLTTLGGSPQSGPATADAAQLIPDDIAGGQKAGYTFAVGNCVKEKDAVTSYKITAVPNEVGHSGSRGFCVDQSGQIMFDPHGGTNCTELLQ